jgi:hypothetical protein
MEHHANATDPGLDPVSRLLLSTEPNIADSGHQGVVVESATVQAFSGIFVLLA